MEKIIGIDSETLVTGRPFMFGTSLGEVFTLEKVPGIFFEERYINANFVLWNIKFDSGSILYNLRLAVKTVLWKTGKAVGGEYRYQYIPHKYLMIGRGNDKVQFWDIQQFFGMSLESAATKYLNEHKHRMKTLKFTERIVRKEWNRIGKYCIQDATLTARLAIFLKGKLHEFGIEFVQPYSGASLSFAYYRDRCRIVTAWRFWRNYRDVLRFACEAYQGGKFEVTKRGSFTGYEYDIVSAYPYEIANLIDISFAKIKHAKGYQSAATYGFARCIIDNPNGVPVPFGIMQKNVRVYGAGKYLVTLTKAEIEYCHEFGIGCEVLDGWWLTCQTKSRPYKKVTEELFRLKDHWKGKDDTLCNIAKRMMNSFYGKAVQLIRDEEGRLVAGCGWNPIYGAIITANVRLRMARYQVKLGDDCIAVHTDSIITTRPLPDDMLSPALGGLKLETSGDGIIVMSGQYQIAAKSAYRGFVMAKDDSWRKLLTDNARKRYIDYPQVRAITWIEALSFGWTDKVNVFQDFTKRIDPNTDVKRIWFRNVKCGQLLEGLESSAPKIILPEVR